jgi:hypothetical protein
LARALAGAAAQQVSGAADISRRALQAERRNIDKAGNYGGHGGS